MTDRLSFGWQGFDGFDAPTLYDMLRFRQDVFIVEQQSPYPDLDGLDPVCQHLLVRDTDGRLAAYLRARGPEGDSPAFIGRIVVGPGWRGTGLGRRLIQAGLDFMDRSYPGQPIEIGAQQHLADFYAGFGFVAEGEPYDDGGIPHVTMWRR
ncbi:GNAT family N-acetyltransferase [Niveispirillum sp.]|uniref:GNAT family N-acetyltransferase n=1 Tax=Niveispirillum sp. TaxID=1917217 RepID=UPI0025D6ED5F|nr:GNAT family N-acetyltransferase [Niveispirillum sp.]